MATSKALAARPDGMANIGVDDGRLNDVLEAIDTIALSALTAAPLVRLGARP
ncbi:MAG: hypothetical protein ABJB98_12130 [Actinomycetota bacterium]